MHADKLTGKLGNAFAILKRSRISLRASPCRRTEAGYGIALLFIHMPQCESWDSKKFFSFLSVLVDLVDSTSNSKVILCETLSLNDIKRIEDPTELSARRNNSLFAIDATFLPWRNLAMKFKLNNQNGIPVSSKAYKNPVCKMTDLRLNSVQCIQPIRLFICIYGYWTPVVTSMDCRYTKFDLVLDSLWHTLMIWA